METFRFLVEILSYDDKRRHEGELIHRSAELTPLEVAAMICIQGESYSYDFDMNIVPVRQETRSKTTPFYNALFTGLVRYWNQSQDPEEWVSLNVRVPLPCLVELCWLLDLLRRENPHQWASQR